MNSLVIQRMYAYHFGMHRKVWDTCISTLTDVQFLQDIGYSLGSIRNQCVHVIGADERWFARIQDVPLPDYPTYETHTTKASVRARWDETEKSIMAYLDTLTDADLSRVVRFDAPQHGGIQTFTVWEIVLHVFNHGTDHRAQILAMLHQMGAPTLDQGLTAYWRE